jgi:hypothetical protein
MIHCSMLSKASAMHLFEVLMFPRFEPWFLLHVSTGLKNGSKEISGSLALPAKIGDLIKQRIKFKGTRKGTTHRYCACCSMPSTLHGNTKIRPWTCLPQSASRL